MIAPNALGQLDYLKRNEPPAHIGDDIHFLPCLPTATKADPENVLPTTRDFTGEARQ